MMLSPGGVKIWRPRQLYIGEKEREYTDVASRREKFDATVFDAPTSVMHGGDSKRNLLATYRDEKGNLLSKSRL